MSYSEKILENLMSYDAEYRISAFALVLLILGFFIYHMLSIYLKRRIEKHKAFSDSPSYISSVGGQRISGFILYGIIPFTFFYSLQNINITNYGINLKNFPQSLVWIGLFAPVILLMNYIVSGKPSNLKHYPQIRIKYWKTRDLTINFMTWMLYLLAYEILFRGFLLFSFYHAYGMVAAIAVNVVLYSLVHIPKGSKETIGAIPFGVILCLISLNTGSFFAAFMIHTVMAVSNEFFSIKAHPEMSIKSRRI